jgi:RNA polymerase sigma factor (sigma-70 family)
MDGHAPEEELRAMWLRGLDGDAKAYEGFLRRIASHLRRFLSRRLFGYRDDIEDLVQECLLALHNQRHTYHCDQPLTAWVHAIARYKVVDLLRAKSRRDTLHDPLHESEDLIWMDDADARESRFDLSGLLDLLPERQRLPIIHVKIEGLSVIEASRLTGLSESAVKIGIHRGLKTIAAQLQRRTT